MNIRCPHCETMFRVNPDRIPSNGVRAKCARCGDTFLVTRAPQAGATPPSSAQQASVPSAPPRRPPAPMAAVPPASGPTTSGPVTPAAPVSAQAPAPPAATPAFGKRDPKLKAERLARALVSDIVAYHPDRLERSHQNGTLRVEFRDEIMKSWEEYVAQVGIDLAKSTPYFRDALNTILAKGQKVF